MKSILLAKKISQLKNVTKVLSTEEQNQVRGGEETTTINVSTTTERRHARRLTRR